MLKTTEKGRICRAGLTQDSTCDNIIHDQQEALQYLRRASSPCLGPFLLSNPSEDLLYQEAGSRVSFVCYQSLIDVFVFGNFEIPPFFPSCLYLAHQYQWISASISDRECVAVGAGLKLLRFFECFHMLKLLLWCLVVLGPSALVAVFNSISISTNPTCPTHQTKILELKTPLLHMQNGLLTRFFFFFFFFFFKLYLFTASVLDHNLSQPAKLVTPDILHGSASTPNQCVDSSPKTIPGKTLFASETAALVCGVPFALKCQKHMEEVLGGIFIMSKIVYYLLTGNGTQDISRMDELCLNQGLDRGCTKNWKLSEEESGKRGRDPEDWMRRIVVECSGSKEYQEHRYCALCGFEMFWHMLIHKSMASCCREYDIILNQLRGALVSYSGGVVVLESSNSLTFGYLSVSSRESSRIVSTNQKY
ncbi:hypothetical protein VP01_158g2 [Puccinia sorghi]|uniref:Uncharacterized protein n=1 Tax=Puccinia sorghi TaxID=27349 RepID=A0A0L6VHJ8_9BASI|nr:hypothetical protein VP01_158g2 [Puccinia sorghi]